MTERENCAHFEIVAADVEKEDFVAIEADGVWYWFPKTSLSLVDSCPVRVLQVEGDVCKKNEIKI